MGQNQSDQLRQPVPKRQQTDTAQAKRITVVHAKPDNEQDISGHAVELQKHSRLHRFWPILRSTLEYEYPLEAFDNGVKHEELLGICNNYQQHLTDCAELVAREQKSLCNRLKDIEMFSAGIVQQLLRRHDNLDRALPHLQKVSEVSVTLEKIKNHIDDCVPLMNKLNNCLPEELRLEYLSLRQGRSPVSELIPTEHIGVTQARDDEMESDSQ